jgi:lectin, mannose-binding 2
VTYFQDKSLKLELQYKNENEWEVCFETGAVTLPSVAYLGFSAETGELSDNFDIISVDTKNLYEPVKNAGGSQGKGYKMGEGRKGMSRGKGAKKSSGWGWFLVKMFLFAGVCGGGYVGYTAWRAQKRHSRFD